MALREILRGLSVTARHLLRKPVTYQYPEKPKPVAPRWHGRHLLNRYEDGLEKCIGCELCAWACPADAIYVQGADNTPEARYSPGERYGVDYQINYLRCIYCGLCIEACPTRALTMSNDYHMSDDHRDKFIFTKEMLLAPLPQGATPPPHTDEEVRARGINYYGGSAFTPYVLSTEAADAAEPVLERRGYGAASSIGSEAEVDRVVTERDAPRDTATVQEEPQEPPG